MSDPAARASVHDRFRRMVAIIQNEDVRDQYVHEFEGRLRRLASTDYGRSVRILAQWVLDADDVPDHVMEAAEALMTEPTASLDRAAQATANEPSI